MFNGDATVNAPVKGFGGMIGVSSHSSANLEFKKEVGLGQSIGISGSYGPYLHGVVTVDDPSSYHETTVMGFGELVPKGLQADAWNLRNDTLSLIKGAASWNRSTLASGR